MIAFNTAVVLKLKLTKKQLWGNVSVWVYVHVCDVYVCVYVCDVGGWVGVCACV